MFLTPACVCNGDVSLVMPLYAFHLQEILDCQRKCRPFYCVTALHIIANNACWESMYYGDMQLATECFHELGCTIPRLISTAVFTLALYAGVSYTMEMHS